jgi:hypothetical protein
VPGSNNNESQSNNKYKSGLQDEDDILLGGSFDVVKAESEKNNEDELTPSGKAVTAGIEMTPIKNCAAEAAGITRIQKGTPIVSKHITQYGGKIRERYFVTKQLIGPIDVANPDAVDIKIDKSGNKILGRYR